jgi:hypothetical protein
MRQDAVSAILSIRFVAPPLTTAQQARRAEMFKKLPELKHIRDRHIADEAGIRLELENCDKVRLEIVSRLEAQVRVVKESCKRVHRLNEQMRAQFFEEV